MNKTRALQLSLALLGLVVLAADVRFDYEFFNAEGAGNTPMMASAAVRNCLTLAAIIGLFFEKRFAGYLLVIAAILGGVRRAQYLAPILAYLGSQGLGLVHSGMDLAFRVLLLALGLGVLLQSRNDE